MSDFLSDPPRWKEGLDQANLAEREAGRAIRLMQAPEPLPSSQLTRMDARIRSVRSQRRTFWITMTAALLLGGATVASAAHLNVLPGWLTRIVQPRPAEPAAHKRASVGAPKRMPVGANEPASAEANPLPVPIPSVPDQPEREAASAHPAAANLGGGNASANDPVPVASPRLARKPAAAASAESQTSSRVPARAAGLKPSRPSPFEPMPAAGALSVAARGTQVAWLDKPAQPDLASPAVPGNPSNAAAETSDAQGTARYLSEAIHALRVEHSPGTALFLLDRHATQLGKSTFAHEALLVRVEAMLALGRKAEVLRLLDGVALTDVAASRSLLVTRGELRAAANRCADGMGDFDLVLARSRQADRQALFGRAVCRKKLGDSVGAQADVERYRREFPADPRLADLSNLR